ncbi:hypothetical protein ACLKA7_003856 [Drosophila subpalustris]
MLLLLPQLPGMRSEAGEKSIQLKLRPVREVQGQRQSQSQSQASSPNNGNICCATSRAKPLGVKFINIKPKGSSGNNSNSSRSWQVEGHGNDSVFRIL